MKKGIILIAIGIMLLVIDYKIPFGHAYPPMETAEELGAELQNVIINNLIGTNPTVDIVSDILAYIFLFVGCIFMLKYSTKFMINLLLIPFATYIYISLLRIPYNLVGGDLYLKVAGYYFLLLIIEIVIELSIIKALVSLFQSMQTKWNVNELLVGFILAMICKGILSGVNLFYGKGVLYYIYTVVMIGATIFYLNRLYVVTKYKLGGTHDEK